MYQRKDGIVDFDPARCIGCKACMQACPYDAIYIDPDSHTAAKCHYCAHRVDVGLEPACVVVCPEHAILAGDMDDPKSEIARVLATQQVRARKPEQGTRPKLFYVDAEEASIVPGLAAQDGGMLWAAWPDHGQGDWRGPIHIGNGNMASALVNSAAPRETYNVGHKIPWHWQVPAYLTAKAIGAGVFIVAGLGLAFGLLPGEPLFTTIAAFLSLLFIGINTGFLVWDLDRPDRFWTILIRPQWRSWLARGAFILIGFSGVGGLYFLGQLFNLQFSNLLLWPGIILAVLSAVYTAFLFSQAEGRDLWQSTLLPAHLFVQAVMAGAAALLIVGAFAGLAPDAARTLAWTFGLSTLVNLLITLGGEFSVPHASAVAASAAHMITHGKYARWYWASVIGGMGLPIVLAGMFSQSPAALAVAGALALVGLFTYEWAFVMAPQEIPNN
jgi:formate-dependent nitrite reductase membrane component NrfD/ferredoxin